MTFDELLRWLYKVATGWLGWTPDVARSAHMQEIIIAYEGYTDMLVAVHGSSSKNSSKRTSKSRKVPVTPESIDAALNIG